MPAVAGLLAFTWGLYSYYRSTHAFDDRSRPEPDPPMAPRAPKAPPSLSLPGRASRIRSPNRGLEAQAARGFRRQKRQP